VISNAVFVMLISKLIYFAFFDKDRESVAKVLLLILCIAELFFKGYGMYFVKEFFDDLKASYTPPKDARRRQQVIINANTVMNNRKTSSQSSHHHRDSIIIV